MIVPPFRIIVPSLSPYHCSVDALTCVNVSLSNLLLAVQVLYLIGKVGPRWFKLCEPKWRRNWHVSFVPSGIRSWFQTLERGNWAVTFVGVFRVTCGIRMYSGIHVCRWMGYTCGPMYAHVRSSMQCTSSLLNWKRWSNRSRGLIRFWCYPFNSWGPRKKGYHMLGIWFGRKNLALNCWQSQVIASPFPPLVSRA